MIEIRLPFPVSVNELFANKKRGGRFRTEKYKAWQTEAGWELKRQRPRPIDGPVTLHYTFEDRHKADLGNLEKGVTDLLVKHGLIDDDGPETVREIHAAFGDGVAGVLVRVVAVC